MISAKGEKKRRIKGEEEERRGHGVGQEKSEEGLRESKTCKRGLGRIW